jgi:uncharacterized membrane protein YfcA
VAALLVGFAKTAIGGLATVSVAVFAAVLPARESTAALLLLLLVGDAVAVWHYRRDGDLGLLRHLIPAVLPGLLLGALVLARVDDDTLRRLIGGILLALLGLQLVLRHGSAVAGTGTGAGAGEVAGVGWSRPAALGVGLAAGFTTMVANAGGAVMTVYLVGQGVDKRRFLGTAAWFFLGVNLCKLPFSVGLGLVDTSMLRAAAVLTPAVLVGAAIGVATARRLGQRSFETAVLAASALSAVPLLLS